LVSVLGVASSENVHVKSPARIVDVDKDSGKAIFQAVELPRSIVLFSGAHSKWTSRGTTSEEDELSDDELFSLDEELLSSDEELLLPDEELLPSDEELLPSDEEESSLSEEELFTLDDELDFSSSTPDEDEEFSELLEDSSCKELISGFGFAGVHESSSLQARSNAHAHATEVAKPSFKRFSFIPSPLYHL
jgi:hypothetical protein